ncbi:glucuronate isomerase [Alkalicoccus luteus]|nr:glucuronate isomerase [Alkalicoccus luteus]
MFTNDFLLRTEASKKLYHQFAEAMPIIDYHNHLSAKDIWEDRNYQNMTEIWLEGDHYKWRAMRANGIKEHFITGEATDKEKFDAWAETVPNLFGNPLYHWTHLELSRFFGIEKPLNGDTKDEIWEEGNKTLASGDLSVRSMLKMQNVAFVGTTDDPIDNLEFHRKLQQDRFPVTVAPSFRPDRGLNLDHPDFLDWVGELAVAAERDIASYDQLLNALDDRIAFFHECGCRASDHGINEMYHVPASEKDAAAVFQKRMEGSPVTGEEVLQYKTVTLQKLAEMYYVKGWAMQLHIGPLRNNFTAMHEQVGPDAGFDSMNDAPVAEPLNRMLDEMASAGRLPKTVLYTLNPQDNIIMATAAGNFQSAEEPGRIQFGTAWWFNDHLDGMLDQMRTLANVGVLRHFIGMLTDSRSFLSLTRHEYFRRILCRMLGEWVEEGMVPEDWKLLQEYVEGICYQNAERYFQLQPKHSSTL